MSASENSPLLSIMNSPLLRQQTQQRNKENSAITPPAPTSAAQSADSVGSVPVEVAPYGFDPSGPTPPMVPVVSAVDSSAGSTAVVHEAVARTVVPGAATGESSPVAGVSSSSGEPVIPAHLLQFWADVETIQEQVSNSLSLEEDRMRELSIQEQQAKTQSMILQALDAYTTALVEVDGDRDRWTDEYSEKVQQQVYDVLYRLGRFQALIDMPEVENIHIAGCDQVFLKFSDGRTERAEPIAATDAELMQMIQNIASNQGDASRPFST